MNTSSAVRSFISAPNLFINAHKAVAGTYRRQSPLGCLSDETEVAEFTKRSYGGMDVTGSGGRSHISLHNIHKPAHLQGKTHPDLRRISFKIKGKMTKPVHLFLPPSRPVNRRASFPGIDALSNNLVAANT